MCFDLKNKEWKEFEIQQLFHNKIGKNVDGNKVNKSSGKVAYITRKESNNGLDGFVDFDKSYLNIDRPVITIGNETAEPFVQNYPFFTGTKVNILIPKEKVSKYVLTFISESLKNHKSKYSYSYTINSTRLKRQKILLPTNKESEPDFAFMEAFMKQKEKEKFEEYKNYILQRLEKLKDYKTVEPIEEKQWSEFFISEVSEILSGRDIYASERIKGNTPYISASANNNGIGHFVNNDNSTKESGCLSVNRNGSVGYSFYHPYEALFGNDCRKLRPKNPNKHVGIFLSQQITRQRGKYGYGYKLGTARLKRQKIILPVNDQNEPDYDYMENYIKQIEYSKLKDYLNVKVI